jgi:hypothetical protein
MMNAIVVLLLISAASSVVAAIFSTRAALLLSRLPVSQTVVRHHIDADGIDKRTILSVVQYARARGVLR